MKRLESDKNNVSLYHLWKMDRPSMVDTCLEGHMGSIWVDDEKNPMSGQFFVGDFCFLAGQPKDEVVRHLPKAYQKQSVIMVSQSHSWEPIIKSIYRDKYTQITRYEMAHIDPNISKHYLKECVKQLGEAYEIEAINEKNYNITQAAEWSKDLCSNFKDYNDYKKRGIGVVICYKGEVVAGASSYTVYKDGIEIQIDTRVDHQRRGLALACGAQLILKCLEENRNPRWDAHNQASLALARKLGYSLKKTYTAFIINDV